ncbi:MAG: MFS transporter [Brevefilum sp.]
MLKETKFRRWIFVLILSSFMLFHQMEVSLLRPVTTQMIAVLNAREGWIDPVITLSVGVSILFALFWGYLFDRHSRAKLLALISFIWGVTSWLVGISPTLATYLISSASGGIDNLSFSGVFSLIGDYFGDRNRGKILGLVLVSQPMALFSAIFIDRALTLALDWRLLLLIIGAIAFVFIFLIILFLHEPKRGAREMGMTDVLLTGTYLFDWETAKENLKVPSLILVLIFSLLGTMPWFVLSAWISPFFQEIGGIPSEMVTQRLLPALIALMIGYPVGGYLGDLYAHKWDTGRITIAMLGMLMPSVFLFLGFLIADINSPYFFVMMILMGFFTSFSWPNVIAIIFSITLPEVRSFTTSIGMALRALGGLIGPYLVSVLQFRMGLRAAILTVTIGGWLLGFLSLIGMYVTLPKDMENLRRHMAYRSHLERRLDKSGTQSQG